MRVTDETPKPDRTNPLLELAAYDRPWVGRLGLALVLFLWLLVSVVGFAAAVWVGLAVAGVGGTLILVEVWLERSGDSHTTFAIAWHLSGKVAAGIALIVMAVVNADGWGTVLLAGFGLLTFLPVLLLATLWWRNPR